MKRHQRGHADFGPIMLIIAAGAGLAGSVLVGAGAWLLRLAFRLVFP